MDEKINELQTKLISSSGIGRVDLLTGLGGLLFRREPDQALGFLTPVGFEDTCHQHSLVPPKGSQKCVQFMGANTVDDLNRIRHSYHSRQSTTSDNNSGGTA